MSTSNGQYVDGPPQGAVILTPEILDRYARRWVRLPAMSERIKRLPDARLQEEGFLPRGLAGEDLAAAATALREQGAWVEIQGIPVVDLAAMTPYIPGSETWPVEREGRVRAWQDWWDGLTPEGRREHQQATLRSNMQIVAAGLVTPRVTPEQARRFGDDVTWLAGQIAYLSGLAEPEVEPPTPGPSAEPTGAQGG